MIRSFADSETADVFARRRVARFSRALQDSAKRKLVTIHTAHTLGDVRVLPGNRLEKLSGDREGQYSIRINAQWRICFRWSNGDAFDVEIVDYH